MGIYHDELARFARYLDEPITSVEITRERLDRQGYTSDGQYFGTGAPLFSLYLENARENFYRHTRGADKRSVVKMVREIFPLAKIDGKAPKGKRAADLLGTIFGDD